MSKLDTIITKLNKSFKEAIVDVSVAGTIKRVYLDSPYLNYIFGGGFGLGRVYEFYGPESGGKSTLATYIGGELQKRYVERPMVLYMDFEYTFDEKYANKLGLATSKESEKFLLARPLSGESGFELAVEALKQLPIGLIIIDSLATISSVGQLEDPNKATFGAVARLLSNGLRFINPYLTTFGTSLILINQERANVGGGPYGPTEKTYGGYAPKYYSSWRGRITRVEDLKEKGLTVGITSRVRNTKNKIGIPKRVAELSLNFEKGFDCEGEYIQFLIDLGVVKQGGAWFSNEEWGFKGQGRDSILKFLKENPELFEMAKSTVNAMMCGETVLDADLGDEDDDLIEEELPIRGEQPQPTED